MILNKIKKIALIPVLMTFIISCQDLKFGDEFLAKPPAGDLVIDDIFSDANYARRALWATYETLPYGLNGVGRTKMNQDLIESLTDLNHSCLGWGGANYYYTGNVNPDTENGSNTKYSYTGEAGSGEWNWRGIRRAHNFIKNVVDVPDMTEDEKKRLTAEAKMIIAIHYCDFFRHFGGVPWIDVSYAPTDDMNKERETAMQTLDNIVNLLDEAARDLPWKLTEEDQAVWDGRLTRAGALGLKARILLFAASPLFNSAAPYLDGDASQNHLCWYGGYKPEMWQRALKAFEDFFSEVNSKGGYKLYDSGANFRANYKGAYFNKNNGEVLISTRITARAPGQWDSQLYFLQSAGSYGTCCPTQNLVDMFPMANGKAINDPDSGFDPNFPYVDRDPRLYETVVHNGATYRTSRIANIYVGGHYDQYSSSTSAPWMTGYKIRKFLGDGGDSADGFPGMEVQNQYIHWPLLRLAELYFGYAEAICQTGGDMNQAYKLVNDVRARAGVGPLKPGLSGEAFIDALLTERAIEFSFEEVRWFDMVRYKRKDIFEKALTFAYITKKNPADANPTEFNYEYRTIMPVRRWTTSFDQKWYLSAFPSNEINKRYGLIQNPGW